MNYENYIVLPKKGDNDKFYLSYSQIELWKKNKKDYIKQYFFGEPFISNPYTDFGKKVGEALEKNNFNDFTKEEQEFLKTIPRYDEFEREVKLDMGEFYIKGFIDTNTSKNKSTDEVVDKIIDYKTGDIKATRNKYLSDNYKQLLLYSAGIEQETNKLPKEADVILIDRKGNPYKEELTLGLKYEKISKKIDIKSVNELKKQYLEIAKEISDYYKVFLKMSEL